MRNHRQGSVLAYAAVATFALVLITSCGGNASPPPLKLKDTDGDQLSDAQEIDGWAIQVDRTGYGGDRAETVWVTSNPNDADSDDDGLPDQLEFQAHSDPNDADTDGDGLGDRDEWVQWKTNPSSVDSDGDARGPSGTLPPSAMLFDGYEIERLRTSPTLADTDGDGRSDYEERDSPRMHPLIAELPRVRMEVEGEVDVRLHVEYEETIGQESTYGSSFSVTTSGSPRSSEALTRWGLGQLPSGQANPTIVVATVGVVVAVVAAVIAAGGLVFQGIDVFGKDATTEITNDITITVPPDDSPKFREDWSRYQTDLHQRTKNASRGTISIPIRLRNEGASTFTLRSLAIGVLKWNAATRKLHGMSTLTLDSGLADGVTLAPGERSPLLIVSDADVDPDTVGLFLEHPEAMVLEHAYFDLEDQKGVDYDFLVETTLRQTGLVEIDFGEKDVEIHRVATNVRRRADSSYAGVTMREVMNDILGLPSDDPTNGYTVFEVEQVLGRDSVPEGLLGLESVRGRAFLGGDRLQAFWTYIASEGVDTTVSFDDIVLHAGETLRLVYVQDADGDGLYGIEEKSLGTTDDKADFDGDGLDDGQEGKKGWDVAVVGATPRRVFADPTLVDSDGDTLTDRAEFELGTDPVDSDTDGDGLLDAVDADPLRAAITLHVDFAGGRTGGDGRSWDQAFLHLDEALAAAKQRNEGNVDPDDDVAAIWVARAVYWPTATERFDLPVAVQVYGGFESGQEKLGARDADPRSNGTILFNPQPNQPIVFVTAADPSTAEDSRVLDGFTLLGDGIEKTEPAMTCHGAPKLRNLQFFLNVNKGKGGALYVRSLAGSHPAQPIVQDCYFRLNAATTAPGGAAYVENASASFERCLFDNNRGFGQGGALFLSRDNTGHLTLEGCILARNEVERPDSSGAGAGLWLGSGATVTGCEFHDNGASGGLGGAINIPNPKTASRRNIDLTNCLLVGNFGRAIYDASSGAIANGHLLSIVNCTVFENAKRTGGGVFSVSGQMRISNSIFWGNSFDNSDVDVFSGKLAQTTVEFSCFERGKFAGPGNSNADPRLTAQNGLDADSPFLDAGNNFVDIHPGITGRQLLPAEDLAGELRIVNKTVDYGCYERQN